MLVSGTGVGEAMTDTNQASELFELCREVYDRTGWEAGDWTPPYRDTDTSLRRHPRYTSDCLLEKLQSWFYDMGANDFGQFGVTMLADSCIAKVRSHDGEFSEQAAADTPLKALLKLTIALDKAGVKL